MDVGTVRACVVTKTNARWKDKVGRLSREMYPKKNILFFFLNSLPEKMMETSKKSSRRLWQMKRLEWTAAWSVCVIKDISRWSDK